MARDVNFDFIIALIKAHKTESKAVKGDISCVRGAHYLLGQVIRQYAIPDENHYISEGAKELWKKVSDDNIWNYVYTNKFATKTDFDLPRYVGAERDPREFNSYKKGEKIEFKSIFHDEHIISVKEIIRQLDEIPEDELNYDTVKRILDSIVICRILKEEDKKLMRKRYATFEENYEKVYKTKNVILISAGDEYRKRRRKDL